MLSGKKRLGCSHTRREKPCEDDAETGDGERHRQPTGARDRRPTTSGRGRPGQLSPDLRRNQAHPRLGLGLQPPEPGEIRLLLLKPWARCWVLVAPVLGPGGPGASPVSGSCSEACTLMQVPGLSEADASLPDPIFCPCYPHRVPLADAGLRAGAVVPAPKQRLMSRNHRAHVAPMTHAPGTN